MKKPLIATASALLLATSLAACGGSATTSPETPAAVTSPADLPQLRTSPDVAELIGRDTIPAKAFVDMVAQGNMYEIEAAKLAEQKSTDPQIKAFAQRMVEDHTQMGLELNGQASVAGSTYTLPLSLDAKHQAMLDQLNAASGSEFDKLYVQMAGRQAHKDTYELMNAMADRGTLGNFNDFADNNKQMVLDHLNAANMLAESMTASTS